MKKISAVLEKDAEVLFAYLFGSYAKGVQGKKSDVDIAIYLKNVSILEKDALYPSRLALQIERALGGKKAVDVRVLNESTLRFRYQVLKYGKLLHSKDEKKRVEFESSSLMRYFDFKPFIESYDAARRARLGV